jgi:hypothetical protein
MSNSKQKPQGWHSRRHETDEAQRASRMAHAGRRQGEPKQVWNPVDRRWERYYEEEQS